MVGGHGLAALQFYQVGTQNFVTKIITAKKLFDFTFKQKSSYNLFGNPKDYCLLANNEVIVILPPEMQIHSFRKARVIELKRIVTVNKTCEWVASLYQNILVACHKDRDKKIKIMDKR